MLANSALFIFYSKILIQIMGYISLFFVARFMGPETLGIIGFATGFVGLFCIFQDLGYTEAHRRQISSGMDTSLAIGTFSIVKLILAIISIVLIASYMFLNKLLFGSSFTQEQNTVIYIILFIVVLRSITQVGIVTFEAKKRYVLSSLPELFSKLLLLVSTIYVAYLNLGVISLAIVQLISAIALFLLVMFNLKKFPISIPNLPTFKKYTLFALPVFLITIMSMLVAFLDKYMIGIFSSIDDLGRYVAIVRLTAPITLVTASITTVLFPVFSKKESEKNFSEIRHMTLRAEKYLNLLLAPSVIFSFVFAKDIIQYMLGSEFTEAYIIFQILVIALYFRAISRPYTVQIIGTGYPNYSAKLGFLLFGVNLSLNLIFIPDNLFGFDLFGWGAVGAALATLSGVLCLVLASRYYAFFTLKTRPYIRGYFLTLIASLVLFQSLSYLKFVFHEISILWIICLFFLSYTLFFLIMFLLRYVTPADLLFFKNVLNPLSTKRYIENEIN